MDIPPDIVMSIAMPILFVSILLFAAYLDKRKFDKEKGEKDAD